MLTAAEKYFFGESSRQTKCNIRYNNEIWIKTNCVMCDWENIQNLYYEAIALVNFVTVNYSNKVLFFHLTFSWNWEMIDNGNWFFKCKQNDVSNKSIWNCR